ncbi:MAG TPA: energy transducer TonB [Thermoanaerobaculia bacterium]
MKRSHRVFYQTLPVSLTLHALVIGGIAVSLLNQLEFPTQSPRQVRAYALVELPPPPPPPPPPVAPKPVPAQQVPQKLIEAAKLLAPTVIPDKIPDVKDTPPIEPIPLPPDAFKNLTPTSIGADIGIAGGIEGGLGVPAPPPPPPPSDGRLHIKRGERVPNKALRQEYPNYPDEARTRGYEDNVVVRYVIGKDGKVKDITIIDPPYRQMFADSVLKTLHDWRFTPYLNENGEPEEVVHEVQFNFQLH